MFNISEKTKKIIKCIVIFLIFNFSIYIQYIPVIIFKLDIQTMSYKTAILLSSFSSIVLFIIFFFIYRKDLKNYFKDFIKNKDEYMDVGIRCWIIGILIMVISNYILNIVLKAGGANNEKAVQSMIKTLPLLMIIDAGIISPFNEEIVFRKTLKDIFKNKWIFVIASFLLFGSVHVLNTAKTITDYLYIIPYGALGASFAYAYHKTNNFFTPLALHIIHNVILIIISILIH